MVVAPRQLTELPREPLPAGVVFARLAPAVASPVAEGLDEDLQFGPVGDDAAALAHRDVMGGIEAERRQAAERARLLSVIERPECVAVVLDEPQAVLRSDTRDRFEVEGVPERVRDEDSPRARRDRLLERSDIDVVRLQLDVDEYRHQSIQDDRVQGRREARGYRDDLVAGLKPLRAELRRRQGSQCEQVRRGTGVAQQRVTCADDAGELSLEAVGIASGCQPEIERGVDQMEQVVVVVHSTRHRNERLAGNERLGPMFLLVKPPDELENLRSELARPLDAHSAPAASTASARAVVHRSRSSTLPSVSRRRKAARRVYLWPVKSSSVKPARS